MDYRQIDRGVNLGLSFCFHIWYFDIKGDSYMLEKFISKYILPENHDNCFSLFIFVWLPCYCTLLAFLGDESVIGYIVIGLFAVLNIAIHFMTKEMPTKIELLAGYLTAIGSCLVTFAMTGNWVFLIFPIPCLVVYTIVMLCLKEK